MGVWRKHDQPLPYNASYDPPLPVCGLTVSAGTQARAMEIEAVIDTGADATIIPVRHLRQIGARPTFEGHLRSQWGERREVFLYLVDLRIGGLLLPSSFVVGDDQGDETILGRDVLNKLDIRLKGPKRLTEIES